MGESSDKEENPFPQEESQIEKEVDIQKEIIEPGPFPWHNNKKGKNYSLQKMNK